VVLAPRRRPTLSPGSWGSDVSTSVPGPSLTRLPLRSRIGAVTILVVPDTRSPVEPARSTWSAPAWTTVKVRVVPAGTLGAVALRSEERGGGRGRGRGGGAPQGMSERR